MGLRKLEVAIAVLVLIYFVLEYRESMKKRRLIYPMAVIIRFGGMQLIYMATGNGILESLYGIAGLIFIIAFAAWDYSLNFKRRDKEKEEQ